MHLVPSLPSPSVDPLIEELQGLVDALADADARTVVADRPGADADRLESTVALRALIDRLTGLWLAQVGRVETEGVWRAEGPVAFASWVKRTHGMADHTAATATRTARALRDHLPTVTAALIDGSARPGHADLLARVMTTSATRTAAAERDDVRLAELARTLDVPTFNRRLTSWAVQVDPEASERSRGRGRDGQSLFASRTFGGTVVLDGSFDAEDGAVVTTWFDAVTSPSTWDRTPGAERLNKAQRRAAALVELLRGCLDQRDPSLPPPPVVGGLLPHLMVTSSVEALESDPADPNSEADPAVLDGAGPLTTRALYRLACDAVVTEILLDPDGVPLSVGRATRVVPTSLRKALVLAYGGCAFPGCDRPWTWTDAHHVQSWSRGGKTCFDNLILLCRYHHRFVHDEDVNITRQGNAWQFLDRHGTQIGVTRIGRRC